MKAISVNSAIGRSGNAAGTGGNVLTGRRNTRKAGKACSSPGANGALCQNRELSGASSSAQTLPDVVANKPTMVAKKAERCKILEFLPLRETADQELLTLVKTRKMLDEMRGDVDALECAWRDRWYAFVGKSDRKFENKMRKWALRGGEKQR
jgi:hypothetical protein